MSRFARLAGFWVKPKIGTTGSENVSTLGCLIWLSHLVVSFFVSKKRDAKNCPGCRAPAGVFSRPLNESELACRAGSDNDSFGSRPRFDTESPDRARPGESSIVRL